MSAFPHHDGSPLYVSTLSPNLGETLTLRLRTHRDRQPETVMLRTVRDGEPHVVAAEAKEAVGDDVWWVAQLTVRNVATHYRWLLVGGAFDFAWLTAGGLVDHDVPDATDFVVSATEAPPAWAHRAVVYQVFPDRFARLSGREDEPALAPDGTELPAWAVPRSWTDAPEGRGPNTAREFFGGHLDGVRAHLDHLRALHADVLYLTPVFPAESTHRYDASSFDHVDPLLGGDSALQRLLDAAHATGVRVIGDITLNHCGRAHDWFVRAQEPHAPEREYFRFDPELRYGYECWFNVPTLPKFDHTSAALREVLVAAEDSPVRTWVRGDGGLDGWRVDVANMAGRMGSVDVTHAFAKDVRAAMAQEGEDLLLVAEHGHDASGDLLGDGWHGTMNYAGFTRQVWCWLRSPDFHETFMGLPVEVPVISGHQAVASLRAFHSRIPWRSLISSWNILGSHDTARIRTVVGSHDRRSLRSRWRSGCRASPWSSPATRSAPPAGGGRTRGPRSPGTTRTPGTPPPSTPTGSCSGCAGPASRSPWAGSAGCTWAPTRWPSCASIRRSPCSWWCPAARRSRFGSPWRTWVPVGCTTSSGSRPTS